MNIRLAHGGGGRETASLIHALILRHLGNPILDRLEDGAVLRLQASSVFTTDSFVVRPLFFPGGDIGKLAACGTLNDLSVMGAIPEFLSLSLILEEGFPFEDLDKILLSVRHETEALGVQVVCGDTKVVEKGGADRLFINTSGIGRLRPGADVSAHNVREGDALLLSGTAGDHGIAILGARKELNFASQTPSDCAAIHPLVDAVFQAGCTVRAMRDPTRGGVAAAVNEIGTASGVTLVLDEAKIPVSQAVCSACNLLGMSPLDLANEGKLLLAVPASDAETALSALRGHPLGRGAAVIGHAEKQGRFPALLTTLLGTRIILETPRGELLPRIC